MKTYKCMPRKVLEYLYASGNKTATVKLATRKEYDNTWEKFRKFFQRHPEYNNVFKLSNKGQCVIISIHERWL